MAEQARRLTSVPARPPRVLVPLIRAELEAGERAGLAHYRKAGELLREAKLGVEEGNWMAWLEENFHLSPRTANRYMRLVNSTPASDAPRRTLSELVDPPRANHQPLWVNEVQTHVSKHVDVERLAEEYRARDVEAGLVKTLCEQIIDVGYKVLANTLHPDKEGGSHEAMERLNQARAKLKRYLA